MKFKIISIAIVVCGLSFAPLSARAKYGGGTGEPNDPYLISTAADMNAIGADANDWGSHFLLTNDINLVDYNETNFNIIGPNSTTPFTGVFDGNDHTISNFTYSSTSWVNYIGLFGYVYGSNAEIKNLGLINPRVNVIGLYIGSIVGYLRDGSVTGCYVSSANISGRSFVGGLIGWNYSGVVFDCYSTASVSGSGPGGLVGLNVSGGKISNCYSIASVSGSGGGLVGLNGWGSTISNCYSSGRVVLSGMGAVGGLASGNIYESEISNCYSDATVYGSQGVGGLVGGNEDARIFNCYSAGKVRGASLVGGLVGSSTGAATTSDSFWDTQTSGQSTSAGGTGLTTAEMQTRSTFTDAGWDFITPIWFIDDGNDYPRLWWEVVAGPVELTGELAEDVLELSLPQGLSSSLLAKLDSALKILEDDNENNDIAAINLIQAFINAVNAQHGKKISEEYADYLITAAQQIIDLLSSE